MTYSPDGLECFRRLGVEQERLASSDILVFKIIIVLVLLTVVSILSLILVLLCFLMQNKTTVTHNLSTNLSIIVNFTVSNNNNIVRFQALRFARGNVPLCIFARKRFARKKSARYRTHSIAAAAAGQCSCDVTARQALPLISHYNADHNIDVAWVLSGFV